jgi:1-acyl-sn-glycerol-3-phosphate acyltransferase
MSNEEARIPTAAQGDQPLSDEELRRQLVEELDELADRLKTAEPGYEPPPFSPKRLVGFVEESLKRFPQEIQLGILDRLRNLMSEEMLSVETWQGIWYMLNYTVQYNVDVVKRHLTGEFDTDEWGLDWELLDVMRPLLAFLYKSYFRVETAGLDHIPVEGAALLVANHSGQIPWDGLMITTASLNDHPAQRLVRALYSEAVPRVPFVAPMLARMGQTLATVDNGIRLLEAEEVVAVFPEGTKGPAKTFKERYRLARFEQADFVAMALNTQAPIIPVSVVGAEETYLSLGSSTSMSRLTGLPYFPITPTFPWLGLLGLVPLPTKWYIDFGSPISLAEYGADAVTNLVLTAQLSDQVRHTIQDMLHTRLAQRRSVFR